MDSQMACISGKSDMNLWLTLIQVHGGKLEGIAVLSSGGALLRGARYEQDGVTVEGIVD